MPMFFALNIWMTVSRRMVTDWHRLDRQPTPSLPRDVTTKAV